MLFSIEVMNLVEGIYAEYAWKLKEKTAGREKCLIDVVSLFVWDTEK